MPVILGGGFIAALVALYKAKPERDLSIAGGYSKLVGDLRVRIDDLETDLYTERAECEKRIDSLRIDFQHQLDELRKRLEHKLG